MKAFDSEQEQFIVNAMCSFLSAYAEQFLDKNLPSISDHGIEQATIAFKIMYDVNNLLDNIYKKSSTTNPH